MERVDADLVPFAQNNPSGYRFAFGTDTATDDINANYNDNIKKGWGTTPNEFPEVEDFNAFAYTSGYLTAYLYQMGIAEWNNKQKYKKYSRVIGSDGKIYKAKTGTDLAPNINNNPTTDSTNWEDVFSNFVSKAGAETIAGVKTFSSSPIIPTPTAGTQAVNKDYADLKVALAGFTGVNQNLTENGYQKLPGGLIIQWGQSGMTSDATATIIFPIAFPSGVLSYSATLGSVLDYTHSYSIGIEPTATPKTMATVTITSTGVPLLTGFSWLVFGY